MTDPFELTKEQLAARLNAARDELAELVEVIAAGEEALTEAHTVLELAQEEKRRIATTLKPMIDRKIELLAVMTIAKGLLRGKGGDVTIYGAVAEGQSDAPPMEG